MARRFQKLSSRLVELHKQLTFEEMKSRLSVSLEEIDCSLEKWRPKYSSEDHVTQLLADCKVCVLLCYCYRCLFRCCTLVFIMASISSLEFLKIETIFVICPLMHNGTEFIVY